MLIFQFRKESAGGEIIFRPRLRVHISTPAGSIAASALLDSGADRTVIPDTIAEILGLSRQRSIETAGIGGVAGGYESMVDITFVDVHHKTESLQQVPVYVLPDIATVVIGRKKIFDEFRVTFEQFNNRILLERK